MATTSTRLTAMGGIPIFSEVGQGSSLGPHSLINIERLLYRIESQLEEEARSKGSDPWKSSGIAISLTHANTLITQLQSQRNLSSNSNELRSHLQSLTQKYVQLYQSEQHQQPVQQTRNMSEHGLNSLESTSYLVQDDLLDDTDMESEFDEDDWDDKENDRAPIGGVKEENGFDAKEINGKDGVYDEYEAATELRRRTNATSKEESNKDAKEEFDTIEQIPPTALQSERSVQDSLSGELLRMAGILKANSIKFADALERDRRILEQADEKLQGNLTLMTRTRGKLGEYSRKARGMGWITLGAVAMVCSSWVVMFVLIRLT